MERFRTGRLAAFLVLTLMTALASGCSWMGRTAGRAQAKAERNVEALEKGYKDGYESERGKTGAKRNGADGDENRDDAQQQQPR